MSQASSNDDSQSNQPEVVPLDPFWYKRWQSLRDSIHSHIPETSPHFQLLLEALISFGAKQFYYFFLGFGGILEDGDISNIDKDEYASQKRKFEDYAPTIGKTPLEQVAKHPPNYVLRIIIDQISRDFEAIHRALRQRQFGTQAEKTSLRLADKWGHSILDKLAGKEPNKPLKDEVVVITYFNFAPRINIIPYANVALVGIPFTTNLENGRRDLLIIPHELGHYLFRFGKISRESFDELIKRKIESKNLTSATENALNWIEEIFSDIFGILSSRELGLISLVSNMLADNYPTNFHLDNQIHPIDAVRISIYLKTVETLNKELNASDSINTEFIKKVLVPQPVADLLARDKRARSERAEFSRLNELPKLANSVTQNNTTDEHKHLDLIIEEIIDLLINNSLVTLAEWEDLIQPTAKNMSAEEIISEWYRNFEIRLSSLENIKSYNIKDYRDRYESDKINLNSFPICYSDWNPIFEADGWAIRGPEGRPTGDWEGSSFHG